MVDVKDSASAPQPSTRERFEEIWPCGEGYWRVPSSVSLTYYVVDVARETCSCDDHLHSLLPFKHLFAFLALRANSAPCSGCGRRFRHHDLYPAGVDLLTFFEGDQLCEECA